MLRTHNGDRGVPFKYHVRVYWKVSELRLYYKPEKIFPATVLYHNKTSNGICQGW
jgi:hypothetical protein